MASSILLVGLQTSGKRAVASALADKLNWDVVDLDQVLEAQTGRKLTHIIAQHGWAVFSDMELDTLKTTMKYHGTRHIISCGTGVQLSEASREILKKHMADGGFVVALEKELEVREGSKVTKKDVQIQEEYNQFFEECSNMRVKHSSVNAMVGQIYAVVKSFGFQAPSAAKTKVERADAVTVTAQSDVAGDAVAPTKTEVATVWYDIREGRCCCIPMML